MSDTDSAVEAAREKAAEIAEAYNDDEVTGPQFHAYMKTLITTDDVVAIALALLSSQSQAERMREANKNAREVIEACQRQFQFYVDQHLAKTPPDRDKAATNAQFKLVCDTWLAAYPAALNPKEEK